MKQQFDIKNTKLRLDIIKEVINDLQEVKIIVFGKKKKAKYLAIEKIDNSIIKLNTLTQ